MTALLGFFLLQLAIGIGAGAILSRWINQRERETHWGEGPDLGPPDHVDLDWLDLEPLDTWDREVEDERDQA